MPGRDETELTDPALKGAAGLLQNLPPEAPPSSMADLVVAQVRPVAVRRQRIYAIIFGLAVVSALAFAIAFYRVLSEGP